MPDLCQKQKRLNLIKDKRGMATVYLLISFTALIIAVGVLTDLTRIRVAQYQLKKAANSAARSVMADYDPGLRNTFGLYARKEIGVQEEFAKYLTGNLNLYHEDFILALKYEHSRIQMGEALDRTDILKAQILEDMKYKAPVDFFRKLADYFKQISSVTDFFQRSNEIRKSVTVINRFLAELNQSHMKIKESLKSLAQNRKKINDLKEQMERVPSKDSASLQTEISRLTQACERTENEIQKEFQRANRVETELELEINKLERKFNALPTEKNQVETTSILPLQKDKVNQNIDEAIKQYKTDLDLISAQLEKSEAKFQTIKGKQGILDISEIGIEAASQANQRIIENAEAGLPENETKTLMEELIRLRHLDNGLETYFEPYEVVKDSDSDSMGNQADSISECFDRLFGKLHNNDDIYNLRDELYIDQYTLTHFSNMTTQPMGDEDHPYRSHEAEYICYGPNALTSTLSQLYFTRFVLDSTAYFAFSQAPVELLQRIFYSLMMGALQAVVDTYKLVAQKDVVPIGNMISQSPLSEITLNYTDHLRILLFLQQDEKGKLSRITEVMKKRGQIELGSLFSNMNGKATASVKLWFMPALGFGNMERGPFGTTINKGVCYITKVTDYSY